MASELVGVKIDPGPDLVAETARPNRPVSRTSDISPPSNQQQASTKTPVPAGSSRPRALAVDGGRLPAGGAADESPMYKGRQPCLTPANSPQHSPQADNEMSTMETLLLSDPQLVLSEPQVLAETPPSLAPTLTPPAVKDSRDQQQNSTFMLQHQESDAGSESHSDSSTSNKQSGLTQYTKTEPLTARQQVALWLTRTSAQDLNSDLSMASLKNLVLSGAGGGQKKQKKLRKDEECGDIVRNFSSKSLIEKYSPRMDAQCDYNPMRKCRTVLTLAESSCPSGNKTNRSSVPTGSMCSREVACDASHLQMMVGHKFSQCRRQREKVVQASQTSLYKRWSKNVETPGRPLSTCLPRSGQPLDPQMSSEGGVNNGITAVRPVNRLRSQSSLQCSRCTSVLSMANSRLTSRAPSQLSLVNCSDRKSARFSQEEMMCKICLLDVPMSSMVKLEDCGCQFCKECMSQYITFEVMEGAYDISCPDQDCPSQGILNQCQMEKLTSRELMDKYRTFRLNTEVCMDSARTFCPSADCDTICHICTGNKSQAVPVSCPTCSNRFCSLCSATWHQGLTCAENGALLMARSGAAGGRQSGAPANGPTDLLLLDTSGWEAADNIKNCPMCNVLIERDAGCAQMMCKRCKHVFCWYCLSSLDDDFLLRHYDSGDCKGKLGHSRASVIWHRAQVIGIFAGFGILLLVASPLLLIAAPCVICCKCRSCKKSRESLAEKASPDFSLQV